MRPAKQQILELMFQALESEMGIIVETSSLSYAHSLFYELKKEQPEDFGCLSLTAPPADVKHNQLWIVRKPNGKDREREKDDEPAEG